MSNNRVSVGNSPVILKTGDKKMNGKLSITDSYKVSPTFYDSCEDGEENYLQEEGNKPKELNFD